MVLKKENYIYTTVTTWGWTDETLMTAILGFLPDDKETHMISGSEGRILWSKTKLSNNTYYSVIDASVRLHKLCDELDFTVTNYGDIIIYRTTNCSFTPQEVLDSYNRYISSSFFIREENKENNKEDNKITIEANKYIYIASNTIGSSDDQLISALLGCVPTCTKYETIHGCAHETIHGCALLWSRTKFIHERSFDLTDAKRRLRERDEKLDVVRTATGDIIVYRNVNNEVLRILDAYYEYRNNNDTEKEKDNMLNNNTFSISNNPAWANKIDDIIFADNMAYMAATQSVPDKLPDITLEDLRIENSVRTEPMIRGTFMVGPGTVRQPSKFHFKQYVGYKYLFEGGYINGKKPPLKFKLIFGQEHATGRYKTICLWEDGEKTIIHGDNKVAKLPVAQAFAWCYVKRTFGTVSHFKKHVDKRTTKMDGVWYFEGDCIMDDYAQGSVPGTSKKRDIYDAAALAIVTKRYGGLRKLVDEYINKEG